MDEQEIRDEPPPILGAWRRVYLFVLIYLAALIVLFYAFTVYFAP
ncbi:MAG TPA: hypothetical protein VKX39_09920 [Bryobacteraceae bacterium]|jgi:hypothetical protein|nr:hypothetical protein [Bryobacteraceae bacterium]